MVDVFATDPLRLLSGYEKQLQELLNFRKLPQIYFKMGTCCSQWHNELSMASAANWMCNDSEGVAVWLGVNLEGHNGAGEELLKVNDRHTTIIEALQVLPPTVTPYLLLQFPDLVISPETTDALHAVVTVGKASQIAWNMRVTMNSLLR